MKCLLCRPFILTDDGTAITKALIRTREINKSYLNLVFFIFEYFFLFFIRTKISDTFDRCSDFSYVKQFTRTIWKNQSYVKIGNAMNRLSSMWGNSLKILREGMWEFSHTMKWLFSTWPSIYFDVIIVIKKYARILAYFRGIKWGIYM